MATWLTHLRVAEIVSEKLHINNAPLFFVGSIAPDNGFSAGVSDLRHDGDKSACDIKGFYRDYILDKTSDDVDFYYGYYVHLYTDVIWQNRMISPLIIQNKDIKKAKQLWKAADDEFLAENNDYCPIKMLVMADNLEKRWFDYCDILTIKNQRDYIIRLSRQRARVQVSTEAKNEIDRFIKECADVITAE